MLQDLVTKSKDLLISFEHLMLRVTPSNSYIPPPAQVRHLSEAYDTFLSAFSAWKAHDSSALLQAMLAQYVELDQIWQTIKDEPEEVVRDEYREGIRENQILLLVRLKRLAGPEQAKALITGAIRKARKERRKPPGDGPPRAAPEASSPSRLPGESGSALVEPKQPSDEALPPAPAVDVGDATQVDRLARVLSVIPENRVVAHEVALNQAFRISAESISNSTPAATVKRAIFDAMRVDVQNGHDQRWILAMAENIRSRLLRLPTPGNALYVLISEALDPAVIARECSMGSFSYEKFFCFMNSLLPRLCAPFRDPDVKALADDQSGDVIDRLERLMHVIDLLSLDYANYLLQESAPRLAQEAPGYEERCFAQDLENGTTSLERVERWWKRARDQAFAEVMKRDPEGVNHPANKPTSGRIYLRGLTDLFIAVSELEDDELPETLHLDRAGIVRARDDTLRIIVIGSILLTAKNLLKREVRTPWKTEAARLWEILQENDYGAHSTSNIQSTLESSHALPATSKAQLASLVARIVSHAQSRQLTDPVMRLLFHRLKTHIFTRLTAASAADRVRATHGAHESLAASGLSEFVGRIGDLVEEVRKVGEVDRASHARWYEEIAQRADADGARGD